MNKVFKIYDQTVPPDIMENMRQARGLDAYDTSKDEEILKMSGIEFLNECLNWEGIIGYTNFIIEIIEYAFGVDLDDYPFVENLIKREVEDWYENF